MKYVSFVARSALVAFSVTMMAGCGGDDGAAGAPGSQGATGPKGASGPAGVNGTTGPAGATGAIGATGAPGATGPSGSGTGSGVTGPTGPAGLPGATGAVGATGASGAVGATGAPGASGAIGATGGVGATGAVGATGPSGGGSLVNTTNEPKGTNCPVGGVKIETGVDANANGTLEAGEVNSAATKYVCNAAPAGSVSTGLKVAVTSVSPAGTTPITVRFTLKDDKGMPVDIAGVYSVNTAIQPRFALAYYTQSTDTNNGASVVSSLNVYTSSGRATSPAVPSPVPTAFTAGSTGQGTIVENGYGAGDYTYTFPAADATVTSGTTVNLYKAVAYDPAQLGSTHMVWIQASRQTDLVETTSPKTLYVVNQDYYFVPNGTGTPLPPRAIASQAACDSCHSGFKAEGSSANAFHSGGRVAAAFCNVCHNPGRTSNKWADSAAFVHRIHYGKEITPANQFHGIAATYPQDIRNCAKCHNNDDGKTANFEQFKSNPSQVACGSCHDGVDFTVAASSNAEKCNDAAKNRGIGVACKHTVGPKTDALCTTCHLPADIAANHIPVSPPDPKSCWALGNATGCNNNTNASYVADAGFVPTGAAVISYDIKSVDAVADSGGILRPTITFKMKKKLGSAAATDVVFDAYAAGTTTEIMAGFVGAPSVYFAWAVPQDGISAPADFNASASGYIKNIWNGTATGTGAGTMTGPDSTGYYTVTLTGVQITTAATMLTGGVGYSYSLSSAPPLVQIDLPAFPYNTGAFAGTKQGGISVAADNIWKVATNYVGRRAIVETSRCDACHGALGAAPTFHAGQRNDGPTCSFCHTPNRTSGGWSAGSKYFIHAIHATRMRETPFNWHIDKNAVAPDNQWEAEFPSPLNDCESCHAPKTYDFSIAANLASIPNQLLTTVATGVYNQASFAYFLSKWVDGVNGTDYGPNFVSSTGSAAGPDTLVISQITTACSSCHDSQSAMAHMKTNGGHFYDKRSITTGSFGESCLTCHGPGKDQAIAKVHQ